MTSEASVKLAVTVTKNPGRSSGYTATFGDWMNPIDATGTTAAEAKANLAAVLVAAITAIRSDSPQFARADDGALHVAVPDYDGGSRWYRVTDDKARLTTYSSHPTAEAFTTCVGMTVVPAA